MVTMKIVLLQSTIVIAFSAKLLRSEYRIYALEGIKCNFHLFRYSFVSFRDEPIMLKILPIILSRISPKSVLLFFFYSYT